MATFVSLATCHHCPVTSSRRGLVYRDSQNLRTPGGRWGPHSPRLQGLGLYSTHQYPLSSPHRADLPESIALTRSKPSGSMKHLVLTHLRRLLTLSSAHQQQRGLCLRDDLQQVMVESCRIPEGAVGQRRPVSGGGANWTFLLIRRKGGASKAEPTVHKPWSRDQREMRKTLHHVFIC